MELVLAQNHVELHNYAECLWKNLYLATNNPRRENPDWGLHPLPAENYGLRPWDAYSHFTLSYEKLKCQLEATSRTISGESRDEILRNTKWKPSTTWFHLEILSIKLLSRISEIGQPWLSPTPTRTKPVTSHHYCLASQVHAAASDMEVQNVVHSDSMSPASLEMLSSSVEGRNCKSSGLGASARPFRPIKMSVLEKVVWKQTVSEFHLAIAFSFYN